MVGVNIASTKTLLRHPCMLQKRLTFLKAVSLFYFTSHKLTYSKELVKCSVLVGTQRLGPCYMLHFVASSDMPVSGEFR